MKHTILLALVAIACSKSTPAKEPAGEEHADHHEDMAPLVTEFHDVLAPVWHAELPDQDYARQACGKSVEMQSIAGKIAAAPAPEGAAAEGWSKHGGLLLAETEALSKVCADENVATWAANVREQLAAVHERFHLLMMASRPEPQ